MKTTLRNLALMILTGMFVAAAYSPVNERELPMAPPIRAVADREAVREAVGKRWAHHFGLNPELLVSVSRRENGSGDPKVWSKTGCCVGLWQINLIHLEEYWDICGLPGATPIYTWLYDPSANGCYGAAILRDKLQNCRGNIDCALRQYSAYVGWKWREKGDGYVWDIVNDALGAPLQ